MMRKPFFMSPSARFTSLLSLKRLQVIYLFSSSNER